MINTESDSFSEVSSQSETFSEEFYEDINIPLYLSVEDFIQFEFQEHEDEVDLSDPDAWVNYQFTPQKIQKFIRFCRSYIYFQSDNDKSVVETFKEYYPNQNIPEFLKTEPRRI